jgi:hypothetical protein
MCVKVKKHEEIGETVSEWQKNAWSLHTYQVTGFS